MNRHIEAARSKGLATGLFLAAALVATLAATLAAGVAVAAPEKPGKTPCFYASQWGGWKAPSPTVIYLGVNMHDVYRVDLAAPSPRLQDSDVHLVSVMRGSSSICTALDLQLSLADGGGFREPLFPTRLTKLTPEEVAAIPKKFRPN